VPASITISRKSVTVLAGQSASFSVGATGTQPLTYQWRKGGAAIAGANGSTYTIAATAVGDSGVYSVAVSNSVGGVISSNATLTVTNAIADTTPPTVLSVSGDLNLTNFTVSFSERVGASASNAANYKVALTNGPAR
jgi:hypothetical protein